MAIYRSIGEPYFVDARVYSPDYDGGKWRAYVSYSAYDSSSALADMQKTIHTGSEDFFVGS